VPGLNMGAWLTILRRHRVVRASAAAIFLYGFAGAATSPYQAVVAIRELGISDRAYATIALVAAIANVVLSIGIGMLSDRFQSYRRPLIVVSAFGVLGYGVIWAFPSPLTFALAMIGPLALFHATNSMLFGNVRAQTERFDPEEAAIVNVLMRMMISLSWVLVPGVVALMLAGRHSMIPAWAIAALVAGVCLACIVFWLEPDHRPMQEAVAEGGTGTARVAPSSGRTDRPAQVRLNGSVLRNIGTILHLGIIARIAGVALITQVLHVNNAVLPLILTGQAQGTAEDIGFTVGMVAALEVVFMILWVRLARSMHLTTALLITSVVYLGYLVAISVAQRPEHVYLASIAAGFAAAGIISLPISYLLDLIKDRPGLSASLIAVNAFLGGALGAGIFALGTALGGYPAAALMSGGAAVIGAVLLVALERRPR